jgi:hypothetical protein
MRHTDAAHPLCILGIEAAGEETIEVRNSAAKF